MPVNQRYKTILLLGLPIIGGMLSQSVLNLIDAAMVGSLGDAALAGVGAGSYANFVAVSLILGLSSGVQAMVARRRGQGRLAEMARPINWGLLLSLLFALPLSLAFIHFSTPIISLISSDKTVVEIGSDYFDYRTLAMLAVGMNLSFRGWWNGIKQPGTYLATLIFIHVVNVILSYALIFGHAGLPEMGAAGAGLGTALALYLGAVVNAVLMWKHARQYGFLKYRKGTPSLGNLLRLSVPHSLQQFFFAAGICTLFWIIGQLGTEDQAIAHVLINLALFLILPGVGFGIASTSLVSHSLGEQNAEQACQWGWDTIKTALSIITLLSLPLWLLPDTVLGLFIQSEALLQRATPLLQITALAICLDTAAIVLAQAMLGAGANRPVLYISTVGQWFFYLPLAWLVGPYLGFGLFGIWLVQLLHRTLSSLAFAYVWSRRQWTDIAV